MKIRIELDDGYEQVIEVDEEQDEIEDLGTTKEMMQARIEELEELNRDKSGDVAFYHEANKACQKEINALRDKAKGWEKRCEELEQELRDAQDRIHEQDWVIAMSDDENRELKDAMDSTDTEISMFREELVKAEAEAKVLRDQLAEKTAACEKWETIEKERKDLCDNLRKELNDTAKQLKCMKERGYLTWKTYFEPCAEPSDIDADLTTRAREIHDIAVDHGWYDPDEDGRQRSFPEIAMLCVCELAEAVESYRKGEPPVFFKPVGDDSKRQKPEGYAVEMMDCVIRILDWFGYAENEKLFSETPDEVMDTKCEYNKTRPYRHGGKKL